VPLTPAQFRARFREFRHHTDESVQPKLDEAYRRTGDSWGDSRDDGACWLTAHLIAVSPLAEPSSKSVKSSQGRTAYLAEYERLLAQVRVWGTTVSVPAAPEAGD
jgi:hypothetical protein